MGSLKSPCLLIETDNFTCDAPPLDFFFIIIVFSELSMNSVERAFCTPPPQPLPPSFPPTSKSGLVTCAPPLHNYHTITHMQSSFYKMCFWMDDQRTADLSNRAFSKQLFTSVTLSHHHRGAWSAARHAQLKSTFQYYVNINNLSGVSSMRMSLWGWGIENVVSALFKSQTIYTIISGFVVSLKHSSFEKQQSLIYISDQTWISITCSNMNII